MFVCEGFATDSADKPLSRTSFERRDVGERDVKIDILFCGVCHSDLHQARNEWHNTIYPCLPGHEIVGRVSAVGPAVTKFKVGDLAGVGCMVGSCQNCPNCSDGLEQYCDNGFVGTYNGIEKETGKVTMGGYSEAIVVDEGFTLRIPRTWSSPPSRRSCARASPPTRRCAAGTSSRARRSASWVSAASATWA